MNQELPDVQAVFRRAKEPEIKLPTSIGSWRKQGVAENHLFLLYWICKSLCVDYSKQWKILNEIRVQIILSVSWETYMQFQVQQLELDKEQWTGLKLVKEYDKAVFCHCVSRESNRGSLELGTPDIITDIGTTLKAIVKKKVVYWI